MPVFQIAVADGGVEDFETTDGWGEVPEVDRPVWARYTHDRMVFGPDLPTLGVVMSSSGELTRIVSD